MNREAKQKALGLYRQQRIHYITQSTRTKEQTMTMRIRQPKVTDTNGNAIGSKLIRVEFDEHGPATVMHDGQRYTFTGKTGTNIRTGLAVREMATVRDARLWISLDGEHLWED
jgi:hypothetical protein